MFPAALLTLYCVLVVAASLAGGALPALFKLSHTTLQVMMSGVGGFMIGVAVLHLLPHGYAALGSMDNAAFWMLVGIVSMFFLIRVFHVHQHATMEPEDHEHVHAHHHHHEHGKTCAHEHHAIPHDPCLHDSRFSWLGLAFGLAIHTLIDGLALGAAVAAGRSGEWWELVGSSFAIFLAVALHKPLDALSITTTMAAGGWSSRQRWLANIGFSLMCPLGAALFFLAASPEAAWQRTLIGGALAFSAGVFLCVSLADILPELSFHSHDRWTLSAALLIGIAAAIAIGYLEPAHTHGPMETNARMTDARMTNDQ